MSIFLFFSAECVTDLYHAVDNVGLILVLVFFRSSVYFVARSFLNERSAHLPGVSQYLLEF